MKVLFVSEYFYPRLAGGEIVLWNIANTLSSKGHKVTVISSKLEDNPTYECINNIEIHRPFKSVGDITYKGLDSVASMTKRLFFAARLYLYLNKFLEKESFDVIYNLAYVPTLPVTFLGSKYNIPVITGIGELSGKEWFKMTNALAAVFNYSMEFLILRVGKHNAIRCPSKKLTKKAQSYIDSKIFTIPSPVDTEKIRKAKKTTDITAVRQKLGIGDKEIFLLFVGSLLPVKNLDSLITILPNLDTKFKLVIVGEGPDREKLENLVEELELNKRVILLGQKSHFETLSIMDACDIFILPSKVETFSTVVIEALSLNKPVISRPVGGVPEIESPNLYVVDNISEISELLQNEKIEASPQENTIANYSPEDIGDKFEEMLIQVSGGV